MIWAMKYIIPNRNTRPNDSLGQMPVCSRMPIELSRVAPRNAAQFQ